MTLDTRTLFAVAMLIAAVIGCAQLLAYFARRDDRFMAWLGASNLVRGGGVGLTALRGVIPSLLWVAAGTARVVAGFLLFWMGARRSARQRLPIAAAGAFLAVFFLVFAIPTPLSRDLGVRIAI